MGTSTRVRIEGGYQGGLLDLMFYVTDCDGCGVIFAITKQLEERRREDHKSFWCPNGHSMSFGENTKEKELREAKRKAEREEALRRDYQESLRVRNEELKRTERSLAATKGVLTKTKKRAAKGVCPEPTCKRSFVNVARHVASQHPDLLGHEEHT